MSSDLNSGPTNQSTKPARKAAQVGEFKRWLANYQNTPMTELEKIVVTAAVTIVGGLFVYVAGQLLSKFFIEPTHELKKAIGEVRFNLAFHGPTIHTPISRNPERSQKAYEALMKSSCDLLARVNAKRASRSSPRTTKRFTRVS